ncbi:MAG: PAS domain-containing protein [Methanomicrobiaceae archaeon]|nr:PAS domain-containing protein [Methanomicrobiaceae archaeon]
MKPKRILLAIDDIADAMELKLILRKQGYEVLGLSVDSCDAILQSGAGNVDLVIIESEVAGSITAINAAKKIKMTFGIPVIFIIGTSDREVLSEIKKCGFEGFFIRPFSEDEVIITIEQALKINSASRKLKEKLEEANIDPIKSEIEKIPAPTLTVNRRGAVTRINKEMELFSGFGKNEMIGKKILSFLGSKETGRNNENETFPEMPDNLFFRLPGNKKIPVRVNTGFVRDYSDNFEEQIFVINRDLNRDQSYDSGRIYDLIFNSMDEIVFSVDRSYHIGHYNNKFSNLAKKLKITGFQLERPIYETGAFSKIVDISDYDEVFRTSHQKEKKCRYTTNGENITLDYSFIPVKENGTVSSVITIIRDVTDLEEAKKHFELIYREFTERQDVMKSLHTGLGDIRTALYQLIKLIENNREKDTDPTFMKVAILTKEAEKKLLSFDMEWKKYESEFRAINSIARQKLKK